MRGPSGNREGRRPEEFTVSYVEFKQPVRFPTWAKIPWNCHHLEPLGREMESQGELRGDSGAGDRREFWA